MHRAIETRYSGCRFRSRLEARYAVLFDTLKIKWDYEPEGFELAGGRRYLPDFWLPLPHQPGAGYWIEVKPLAPTPDERAVLSLLCESTGHRGLFLVGGPREGYALAHDHKAGRAMTLRWSPAIVACAPVPVSQSSFDAAVNAARSARFEFGESGVRA